MRKIRPGAKKKRKNRKCFVQGDICFIELKGGDIAICDADIFEMVNKYSWHYSSGYPGMAAGGMRRRLHSFIITGFESVDHIDGNKLNNLRSNLRGLSQKENMRNMKTPINNKSGYKGVSWRKNRSKWRATIIVNKKQTDLGTFDDPLEAAKAYDKAAKRLHGEFARLNFPENKNEVDYGKIMDLMMGRVTIESSAPDVNDIDW